MMVRVYGFYDEDRPRYKGTACTKEEGRTRQSESEAADINRIIKKFEQTGLWPEAREGMFADVSSLPTYQDALSQVAKAREVFMKLPAPVRAEFENDPAVLLDAWNAGEKAEVFERIGWLEKVPASSPAGLESKGPEASEASA